jgi:hypothetical protein
MEIASRRSEAVLDPSASWTGAFLGAHVVFEVPSGGGGAKRGGDCGVYSGTLAFVGTVRTSAGDTVRCRAAAHASSAATAALQLFVCRSMSCGRVERCAARASTRLDTIPVVVA